MDPNLLTVLIVFQKNDFLTVGDLVTQIKQQISTPLLLYYSGHEEIPILLRKQIEESQAFLVEDSLPRTLGFGINQLAEQVTTPWFLVLDADLKIPDDFIVQLRHIFTDSINPRIGAIQCLLKPTNENNPWSHYECLGDLMSYLSDRTRINDWFTRKSLDITTPRYLTVLQGGARMFNTTLFSQVGKSDDTNSADRGLGVKIKNNHKEILFDPRFLVYHHYPETLCEVIKRKWHHSKGSASLRIQHGSFFKNSLLLNLEMYKSCIFPPKIFRDSWQGRVYYFFSMGTFTTGLIWHLFHYSSKSTLSKGV